jgi:L-ascorbate metabolism protein UlaG (beta-lactamase superfamily)
MRSLLKNKLILIALSILFCGASTQHPTLNVSYLGNCSFLYQSANKKVLIDPLGTEYGNFFYLPSNKTKNSIIEGTSPFDSIDLLLITHIHGDHFNPFLAESFLLRNPHTKMVCPPQVYNIMKDSCRNIEQITPQIISTELAISESKTTTINGISLTIIRMQHGTDRSLEGLDYSNYTEYEKTENYGYIIHLDNKNIFHQGDACLKMNTKALAKNDSPVNIAHLSYFDWDTTSLAILKNNLRAEKIIFMHGTQPGKELETEQFKKIAPELLFFSKEQECKYFD